MSTTQNLICIVNIFGFFLHINSQEKNFGELDICQTAQQ